MDDIEFVRRQDEMIEALRRYVQMTNWFIVALFVMTVTNIVSLIVVAQR